MGTPAQVIETGSSSVPPCILQIRAEFPRLVAQLYTELSHKNSAKGKLLKTDLSV